MSLPCALNPATAGQGLAVADYVRLAARHGFDWIEFDSAQIPMLLQDGDTAAADLLGEQGIRIASFFLPVAWRAEEDIFVEHINRLPGVAASMRQLGATRCCTWLPPNLPTTAEESRRWVGARFGQIAGILAAEDLKFGLEFLGPRHFLADPGETFLFRMEDMLEFAMDLGPNVGVLVDSLHWHCLGSDVQALSHVPPGRLVYAHINDAPAVPLAEQRDDDRLLPGDGSIDLCGFLAGLDAAGYDGPIGIEVDGAALASLSADDAAREARRAFERVTSDCARGSGASPHSAR